MSSRPRDKIGQSPTPMQGRSQKSSAQPRFSVVIPTYQRRERLLKALESLGDQQPNSDFEVVVVVDGSSDDTAAAARELETNFRLRVVEQENRGLANARNRGAKSARGEILLFLDDDMIAEPQLLAEHDRSHREGADVVLGSLRLHPDSPGNLLAQDVAYWCSERDRELAATSDIPFHQIFFGQLSIRREVFWALGGFDEEFTRDGSYGGEDVELGYRLLASGCQVLYNPQARSWQFFDIEVATHVGRAREMGHADTAIARKHPELADHVFMLPRQASRLHRILWRPVLRFPRCAALVAAMLTRPVVFLVNCGCSDWLTARIYATVVTIEYWRGVGDAGASSLNSP